MGLPPHITPEKTDTLGLQLVNSLVSQIDGSLQMDITQGTKFIITFHEVEYLERI
jgi:two-component sensor histidine kinase